MLGSVRSLHGFICTAYSICAGGLQSSVCGGVPVCGVAEELSLISCLSGFSVFQLGAGKALLTILWDNSSLSQSGLFQTL